DVPLFYVSPLVLGFEQRLVKRIMDVAVALVLVVLSAPIALVAALAIRISSPEPVLFRQVRVGRNSTLFHIIKFRTMIDGAEAKTGPVFATEDDPRITPIGKLLRRT